jgi:hypothetical protein
MIRNFISNTELRSPFTFTEIKGSIACLAYSIFTLITLTSKNQPISTSAIFNIYMLNDLPNSVFAPEPDTLPIQRLEAMLEKSYPKLVGLDGEEIMLPDSIYQALRQVIHMMASGQVISLVPYNLHLSTIQASDLLNVSRPYL